MQNPSASGVVRFCLWEMLQQKLKLHEDAAEVELSPRTKLLYVMEELNSLIDEFKEMLSACCENSVKCEENCHSEAYITVYGNLSKLFINPHFKLRQAEDIDDKYQHIFSAPEVGQEDEHLTSLELGMVVPVTVKIEENSEYFCDVNLDECDGCDVHCSSRNGEPHSLLNKKLIKKKKSLYPSVAISRKGAKHRAKLNADEAGPDNSVAKDDLTGPPFVCPHCNVSYSQKKNLKLHLKSEKCLSKPDRPKYKIFNGRYLCLHPSCLPPGGTADENSITYSCPDQIWQHFAEKHVEDQSTVVTCELCGKKFPSQSLVEIHFKKNHEPKFTCKFCGQACMSRQKLQDHERRHTGEKPFQCDQCDFRTNFKNSLKTHKIRLHGKPSAKKHMCELCGKSFFTKTSLKEHIITHTDAKRYSCEICGKLLRNDSSYRRHMMCVHSIKHTCEVCGKEVYSKSGILRHKKEAHGILP